MRSIKIMWALSLLLWSAGCKDDSEPEPDVEIAAPTVSLAVPGLTIANNSVEVSIQKDSTLKVTYAIVAEGGLENLVKTVGETSAPVEVTGQKQLSGELIVDLPFEDATIDVKVQVTDARDAVATANLKIVVTAEETVDPVEPGAPVHGALRSVTVAGAGTKTDYNDANYTFFGHRHMHHRATDFDNAINATPDANTKAGWQGHLDGIYPILTSDDFNNQATASGTTLELTGGPTHSGKWLRRQSSAAIKSMFPANSRLRNWNLFNNSTYKPAVYVSFYLQNFRDDDAGKIFRIYWRRDLPADDKKYSTSFWVGQPAGNGQYTWRLEWADNGELPAYSDQQFDIDNQWNRIEFLFDFDNDRHAVVVNGTLLTDVSRSYNGWIPDQMSLNAIARYALLGNTVEPMLEDGHHIGWAQPYCDFSLKRIEIADSPDWSTKTKSVVQPVTSWESDNIEFVINQGDFEDLEDKHVFYLDGLDATYVGPL